jgi:hypothetical protein
MIRWISTHPPKQKQTNKQKMDIIINKIRIKKQMHRFLLDFGSNVVA